MSTTSPAVPHRGVGVSGSHRRAPAAAWRHIDMMLVLAVIGVACLGVLMVFSASRDKLQASGLDPNYYLKRQTLFVIIGVGAMALIAAIDYRRLRDFAPLAYGATVFLLLALYSPLGRSSRGAQKWFQLGGFQLQPSEFAKVALILALAAYCAQYRGRFSGRQLAAVAGAAAVPLALVYKQPDLGTALVLAVVLIVMLIAGGAKALHLAALLAIAVVGIVAVLQLGVLKQYQKDRLTAFLNPAANTQATTYNLNQSKIAISSGGLSGKGLFRGTQTNLSYVPEQQTDFIFTAVGEQLGLVGSALLLGLFVLMVWRTWRAAVEARDLVGTLLCVGVLAMLVFQVFENVGMTMGIMPITGITLPFMSYGGSSVLASFAAVGLVLNVQMRRFS
jgi:rod shape determining protein RodA